MRVLITNDDGINATGLKILAKMAKKFGDCFVIAPLNEQSAKSHALNLNNSFQIEKVNDLIDGVKTYIVDSTPADCVRTACYFLKENFDLVFSGINHGYNLGEDIFYSGTVAAAIEGVLCQKKALSFSMAKDAFNNNDNIKIIEKQLEKAMNYIFNNHLLDIHSLYNVNIPLNNKQILLTYQSIIHHYDEYYHDQFDQSSNKHYINCMSKPIYDDVIKEKGSDFNAVLTNNISITPLKISKTEDDVLKYLKNKNN